MTHIINQRAFITHLMVATGSSTYHELGERLTIHPSVFTKLYYEAKPGMKISTLMTISQRTGIKVSKLAGLLAGEEV